jgi:lipid-A-disaccharide synthase-like uncharacterized protein
MLDVNWGELLSQERFWLMVGFLSQALFAGRFIVQWIASEVRKVSYIPLTFWYLSIVGSIGLLMYATYRKDPVFIVGQAAVLLIYFRNITLIKKARVSAETDAGERN